MHSTDERQVVSDIHDIRNNIRSLERTVEKMASMIKELTQASQTVADLYRREQHAKTMKEMRDLKINPSVPATPPTAD